MIHKLCMDNAGENKKIGIEVEKCCVENPVVIEYTARDTPQQNSPVEVVFYALLSKQGMCHNAPHKPTYGNEVLTVL